MDTWKEAVLACAMVSNEASFNQRALQHVASWIETNWPDVSVEREQIEIL
jgi:uncharacterized protein YlxP (DUF503 family)